MSGTSDKRDSETVEAGIVRYSPRGRIGIGGKCEYCPGRQ